MQTTDTARRWIEAIGNPLRRETNPQTARILVRALRMLVKIRLIPHYMTVPAHLFAELAKRYRINIHTRFDLANAALCFTELSDADAAIVDKWLVTTLKELVPQDSLRAHLSEIFEAKCVDTDHIVYGERDPILARRLLTLAMINIAAPEDFTVRIGRKASTEEIREAIRVFYDSRGYEVTVRDTYVAAERGEQSFMVGFSSGEDYFLVTVSDHFPVEQPLTV